MLASIARLRFTGESRINSGLSESYDLSLNGKVCLNWLSQPRGQAQPFEGSLYGTLQLWVLNVAKRPQKVAVVVERSNSKGGSKRRWARDSFGHGSTARCGHTSGVVTTNRVVDVKERIIGELRSKLVESAAGPGARSAVR